MGSQSPARPQCGGETGAGGGISGHRRFHAQQAAEKYLKALLTRHQVEFPKTHVIRRLLLLLEPVEPRLVCALSDAEWLSPFGVDVRYPTDGAEALPGDELRGLELAQNVERAVMAALKAFPGAR